MLRTVELVSLPKRNKIEFVGNSSCGTGGQRRSFSCTSSKLLRSLDSWHQKGDAHLKSPRPNTCCVSTLYYMTRFTTSEYGRKRGAVKYFQRMSNSLSELFRSQITSIYTKRDWILGSNNICHQVSHTTTGQVVSTYGGAILPFYRRSRFSPHPTEPKHIYGVRQC